jgi:hypothetical protein
VCRQEARAKQVHERKDELRRRPYSLVAQPSWRYEDEDDAIVEQHEKIGLKMGRCLCEEQARVRPQNTFLFPSCFLSRSSPAILPSYRLLLLIHPYTAFPFPFHDYISTLGQLSAYTTTYQPSSLLFSIFFFTFLLNRQVEAAPLLRPWKHSATGTPLPTW